MGIKFIDCPHGSLGDRKNYAFTKYKRDTMTTTDFIEITLGALLFMAFIIYPIIALAKVDKKKEENSDHS